MPPAFRLHVTPAEGAPFDFAFQGDAVVVGRAVDVGLCIADPFLSRRHSRFFRVGSTLLVEDLGSRNGTLLNGQMIVTPTAVKAGDVVQISQSSILVHAEQTVAPLAPAAEEPDPFQDDATIFRLASEVLDRQRSEEASRLQSAAELRRYADRLRLLNEVHQALGRSLALDELLELILDRVFDHLKPDRGIILLRTADGGLRTAASRSVSPRKEGTEATDLPVSRSLVREVLDKGMAALALDVQTDARFSKAESILLSGIRSLVAAPLLHPEGIPGMIALEAGAGGRVFEEGDLELLISLASVAALHLRNLELLQEAVERRRLQEELALARRIQVALLPDRLPTLAGWELYGLNDPSRGVSGDYYQVVERSGGRECVLLIADVSGKGMAASLLTVSLQALSEGPIEDGLPPDEISTRLSRLLFKRTPPEKYATAFLGVLTPATGVLRYTNAGHNPPLVVRGGRTPSEITEITEITELAATGPPLGLLANASYRAGEVTLGPGDLLALYTDGIVEAADPDGEEYGLERLKAVCLRHRSAPCATLADALDRDLLSFVRGTPFPDDRTVVLARRTC
jgi:sigma-B regulation protein RsbU (phosphoserine phosphatase)